MATSMVEIDLSKTDAIYEFSGSSEADVANAKTFWKSVMLMPPMESRLVSGDIRQRLKVAGPFKTDANITHQPMEYPTKLAEFLAKAQIEEDKARFAKNQQVNERRDEQRQLLHEQRQRRIEKEAMSNQQRIAPQQPPVAAQREITWQTDEDPDDCLRALDEFDDKLRDGVPPTPDSVD